MSLKKTVKDIGIIGISRILLSVAGIILIPFLTKILGEYEYGLWVQVGATIGIMTPIIRLGLPYASVRIFPSKENIKEIGKDFSSITFLVLITSICASTLIFLFPSILANAIFEGRIIIVKILAVFLFIRAMDEVFITVFRAFREMKTYAILEVTTRYSEIALAVYLVIMGYGLIGAILAMVFVRGLLLLVLMILISRKLKFTVPQLSRTKEYLTFGIPLIPSDLSVWLVSTSDRLLIGFFLGAAFVGYYTPGYVLGMAIPAMFGSVLVFVLTPAFSEYYENDEMSTIYVITSYSVKFFLIISSLYFVGVLFFGRHILEIFTTPAIAENGYVIIVFTAVTGFFMGIYTLFSRYIILKNRTKLIASFWMIASFVNISGNILLIPRIGIVGAAITTVISYLILLLLAVNFAFKNFDITIKLDYIPKLILTSFMTCAFIFFIINYLTFTPIYIDIFLGSGFYLLSVLILKIIKKEEIGFLKSMIGK